jgi:protein-disulfide isomerase
VKKASIFLASSFTISAMPNSKTAPLLLIILAVAVAGGIALYMSRQGPNGANVDGQKVVTAPGTGRVRGAEDAPITLVEYGDYQCPTCGHYHPIIMELLSRYQGKLKLEYHHFPLIQIHPNAMLASKAAESAGDQGKFWEMHDLLYARQQEWSPSPNAEAVFLQYASLLGLDTNAFMRSIRSPETEQRVLADVRAGSSIVEGTPTFALNGEVLRGDPPGMEGLVDRINRLLPTAATK